MRNGKTISGINKNSDRFMRRHPPKWLTTNFKLVGYKDLTDEQIQNFVKERIAEIEKQKPGYKYKRGESFIDEKEGSITFKFYIKYVG